MAAFIESSLIDAINTNNHTLLRTIVSSKAWDLNKVLPSVEAPALIVAVLANDLEAVKILVENGADPNVHSFRPFIRHERVMFEAGFPAIFPAFRNQAILDYLVRNGADVNATDEEGNTFVHACLRTTAVLTSAHYKLLREFNFNFDVVNNDGVNIYVELLDSAVDKGHLDPAILMSIISTFARHVPINSDISAVKKLPSTGNAALLTPHSSYDTFYGLVWGTALRGVNPITPEYRRLVLEGKDEEASAIFDPFRKVDMDEKIIMGVASLGGRLTQKEALVLAPAVVARAPASLVRVFLKTGGCVPATIDHTFTPEYLRAHGRQRIADILLEHMQSNLERKGKQLMEHLAPNAQAGDAASASAPRKLDLAAVTEQRMRQYAELFGQEPRAGVMEKMVEIARKVSESGMDLMKESLVDGVGVKIETNTSPLLDGQYEQWQHGEHKSVWGRTFGKVDPETDKKVDEILQELFRETQDPFIWLLMQGNSNKRSKPERDIENLYRRRAGLPPLKEETEQTFLSRLGTWEDEATLEDIFLDAKKRVDERQKQEGWDERALEAMRAKRAAENMNVGVNAGGVPPGQRQFSTSRVPTATNLLKFTELGAAKVTPSRVGMAASLVKRALRLLK